MRVTDRQTDRQTWNKVQEVVHDNKEIADTWVAKTVL